MDSTKDQPLAVQYSLPRPQREFRISRPEPFWRSPRKLILSIIIVAVAASIAGAIIYGATKLVQEITSPTGSGSVAALVPTDVDLAHSYGIAAGGSLIDLDDQELDARMAGIAAAGAHWVRFDFKWNDIQPNSAQSYEWGAYDKLVDAAQRHKLFILGILDFTPEWARSAKCRDSDKCAPSSNKQFAAFARAVSARYKDRGLHYWEVWNEPNSPQFWQPAADPAGYTRLLKETASALRAEDSKSHIITAGLSPQETDTDSYSPIDFLKAVYKAGGKSSFDAVADHPYTFPLSPKSTEKHAWYQMSSTTSSLRSVMIANGDSHKKVWITEFGSPTGGPGAVATVDDPKLDQHPYVVDEELQSKILSDAVSLYQSYDWVGPFMYYSYQDAGTTQDTNENFFGIVRADGSQKPAYQTFLQAAQSAAAK